MTAKAALIVWNDIDPAHEAAFNDWYDTEHLLERIAVPGFRTGRRYRAVAGGPGYLAYYELDGLAVLDSAPYVQRLDEPTPRTRRIMPHFKAMHRSACRLRAAAGDGTGDRALLVELFPSRADPAALERWAADRLVADIAAAPDVAAVRFWQADARCSRSDTSESALRTAADRVAEWLIFAETDGDAALNGVMERLERAAVSGPARRAVGPPRPYRLLKAVSA